MIFNGFPPLVHTLVVGIVAYVTLVILLRISGKRTLAKWNAFDLIVTVAFGSTLASSLLSRDVSAVQAGFAFLLLIILQYSVTWTSVRIPSIERIVKSSPTLLVYRGVLQQEALRRERVTEFEVRAALRSHGIIDLKEVGALILETEGSFSLIQSITDIESFALDDVFGTETTQEKEQHSI